MKALVCGSRTLTIIQAAPMLCYLDYLAPSIELLIEGECPKGGADIIARDWANMKGIPVDPHPPEQETSHFYWKRNREMVRLLDPAHDVAIGIVNKHYSPGTQGTIRLAQERKIRTVYFDVRGF